MAKFEILTVLEAVFPHLCADKHEIWHGGVGIWSAPPCQISRLSGQRVALWGEKPILGPQSKNNTGMAGLLVITSGSDGFMVVTDTAAEQCCHQ